jgi:hypothetical protein
LQHNNISSPTSHFRTLRFSSLFQHSSRTRSTFHSRYNIHQEFNQTFHRCSIIYQGFNNISSISKSFQSINIVQEKGGNHLPVPPVGCPCPDDGPIPAAPPRTSTTTHQYICFLKSHSTPYLFQESICSHSSVPHFTPSHNKFVKII